MQIEVKVNYEELIEYNQAGLIPGPEETEQAYLDRVAYCLKLKEQIPQMLAHDIPFATPEMQASQEILLEGCQKAKNIYDIFPSWVPLFFSNYKLSLWQGGCAWIFQQKENTPTSAFFQLRQQFLKSKIYLNLYDRNELISHELAHVGRMKFEEPKFEEILAYRSAKSSFRRYFSPIIQSSYESTVFVLLLIALIVVDIFSITDVSGAYLHLSHILRYIVIALIFFGLTRLWFLQKQFKSCLKNLRKIILDAKKAEAVIYRLTDKEIIIFSKSSPELIKKHVEEQKNKTLRWKTIFEAYFKHLNPSDHYDGVRFHNNPPTERSLKDVLKWMLTKSAPWPKKIADYPFAIPTKQVQEDELFITFVNHSTMLIQWGKLNILTDPIWSNRCSPSKYFGPQRVHAPGIKFEDLPPIHVVLISHNHYDHMDLPTLRMLQKHHHPYFVTGLGNKNYLEKKGIENIAELDWWQETLLNQTTSVIFTPAKHFSARHLLDTNETLWGGFALKKGTQMIYFAGDTAYDKFFDEIRQRLGKPLLALLPIGAFEPHWFMKTVHMSPLEAIQAHFDLGSRQSIAMHFGTFHLSNEAIGTPTQLLKEGLKQKQLSEEIFMILKPGETKKVQL